MGAFMPKRLRLALLPCVLSVALPFFAASAALADDTAAPQGGSATDDLQKQLADTRDQLSTALHSFSLLHDENTQLKEDAEKDAADKAALAAQIDSAQRTIAGLTLQAAAATQLEMLRAQLRQSQDQIAAMAAENAKLKLRLALLGPPPAGGMSVPTRPAQP